MKTYALTPSLRRGILAGALLGLTAITSHAAVVTWGAATAISGDSNVSTAGTLVGAFNLGNTGVGNTTVNGVTFTGLAFAMGTTVTSGNFSFFSSGGYPSSNSLGSGSAPFSLLSAPYQALLSSAERSGVGQPVTLTISGLTIGNAYQFEWWTNDSSGNASVPTTATAGNSVTLNSTTTPGIPGGVGQFALGTFTADASTQVIAFSGDLASINGLQLRQTAAVPEPGTALAGMALVGLCGTLRRRRASGAVQP